MDYSTTELLTWLGKESRLLGWDMITFVDGGTINLVMHQESIRRANTADKIPPISGYIPNGADKRFALSRCGLHLPRLLFDTDLASDVAHLQLTIAEASAYSLSNNGGNWRVRQLDLMGPLQAAALSLDIDLALSGGTVDASQVITLDLSKSENFSIPHYYGDSRLLSEFFQQKFSALTDDQRQIPIGKLKDTPLPLYQPVTFALRTQARGRDNEDIAGAVVIMVCMNGETSGNFPGADYRYLIPKGGEYSACVLFETPRLLMAQVAQTLADVIDGARFEIGRDGNVVIAHWTAGRIKFRSQTYTDMFPITVSGKAFNVGVRVDIPAINLSAEGSIKFYEAPDGKAGEVDVGLGWLQEISVSMFAVDDGDPKFMKKLTDQGYNFDQFLAPVKRFYGLRAEYSYRLERDKEVALRLVKNEQDFQSFCPTFAPIYIPGKDSTSVNAGIVRTISGSIAEQVATRLQRFFDGEALGGLINPVVKLDALLREKMPALLTAMDIANSILEINFDNVIKVTSLQNPLDMVGFGQVNPDATGFTISPMENTLLAGATMTFHTEPAAAASNIDWSADAVSGFVDDVRLCIDAEGGFRAPAASDMTKAFAQVLVTATDKANRAIQRNALITVVSQSLSASPLVVVTPPNSKVNFNAWVLGDPLALEWQYQGKPLGKGQAATVTSPADPGTAAFVVEEVQVQDPVSKDTCTCVLITEMGKKTPMLVSAKVDQAGQTAALEARVNGQVQDPKLIDWKVRYDSGSVKEGVYTPGSGQEARFALISATYDSGDFGIFEGFIVLALPLSEHRDLTVN